MLALPFTIVALVSVVLSFWLPVAAWIIVGIAECAILITLMSLKARKWKEIPELSIPANQMVQKFGHYYAMPFAGRDYSASASACQLTSIVLGIVCGAKSLWWGVGVAVVNIPVMGLTARAFNPTQFLADDMERLAHEEVISYLQSRRRTGD